MPPKQPETEWFEVRVRSALDLEREAITQTVFHGINKSGSLAAAIVLRDAFVREGRADECISHYHRRELSLPKLLNLMRTVAGRAFFAGHYLFNAVEPRPGRVYITQLRHPVPRAISIFHWAMHHSRAVRAGARRLPVGTTLRDYLSSAGQQHSGAMKQIALGFGPHRKALGKTLTPRELRYLAMDSLEANLFLYGIAEYFEESLFLYARLLGLSRIPEWRRDVRNKGRPDLAEIPQADIDAIHEVYEEDILFYNWALDKFRGRLATMEFGPELERYKEACRAQYSNRIVRN